MVPSSATVCQKPSTIYLHVACMLAGRDGLVHCLLALLVALSGRAWHGARELAQTDRNEETLVYLQIICTYATLQHIQTRRTSSGILLES